MTQTALKYSLIIIPLFTASIQYMYFHYRHLQRYQQEVGFWKLQKNWEDMQHYVKNNTPQNAYLMVPHDMEMGGFRIGSERKIICSYRDCGIIGFDYGATIEWRKRLNDIDAFQVFISKPTKSAIIKAVAKYRVNYIVFMNYQAPKGDSMLRKLYANEVFSLYQVGMNPI